MTTITPDDARALAADWIAAGRAAEARDLAAQLVGLYPTDYRGHFLLARAAMQCRDEAAALQAWKIALSLAPADPGGWIDLVYRRLRSGEDDAAARMLLRAWTLSPPPTPQPFAREMGAHYSAALAGAQPLRSDRPALADVTLVCVDGANHDLAAAAMRHCLGLVQPAAALFLTDRPYAIDGVETRLVKPLDSAVGYSLVMLHGLQEFIHTSHALVVQYDGLIWRPDLWSPTFLEWDYIGAPWSFQADPALAVGNGGFSLRSRRLLHALQHPAITFIHPEDVAICVKHRDHLASHDGIKFAPRDLAERFAVENGLPLDPGGAPGSFGFHGLHNFAAMLDRDQVLALINALPLRLLGSFRSFDLAFRYLVRGQPDIVADIAEAVLARTPSAPMRWLLAFLG